MTTPEDDGRSLDRRREEVDRVVQELTAWAATRSEVRGLGMVGSWARGAGRLDSDLDILLLTDDPERLTESQEWLHEIGDPPVVRRDQFGPIVECRVRFASGLELELGIGPLTWANMRPLDAGTRMVVSDGLQILYDPDGFLTTLRAAVI